MTATNTAPLAPIETTVSACDRCSGAGCRVRFGWRGGRYEGSECDVCEGVGTLCDACDEPCREGETCGPCAERALDAAGIDAACIASDPHTGVRIRCATPAETLAYVSQPCRHPSFRKAVRVGDVLVDEDTGPGIWFGGAGF